MLREEPRRPVSVLFVQLHVYTALGPLNTQASLAEELQEGEPEAVKRGKGSSGSG